MGLRRKKQKKSEPEKEEPEDSEIIDTDDEEPEEIEKPKFISKEYRELVKKKEEEKKPKEKERRYYTVDDFIGYPQAVFQKEIANLLLIIVDQQEDIKHLLAELKED